MMKFYAVKKGQKTGIFNTWDEASPLVIGYPGAIYKSFATQKEAQEFLTQWETPNTVALTPNTVALTPINHETITVPCKCVTYTDGSYSRGVGGYGCVFIWESGETTKLFGRVPINFCSNQKAELYAIKIAVSNMPDGGIIKTDSQYAIGSLTSWIIAWQRNGWKTSGGKSVENRELIEEISNLIEGKSITFEHVKGHNGNINNELADVLANRGRLTF